MLNKIRLMFTLEQKSTIDYGFYFFKNLIFTWIYMGEEKLCHRIAQAIARLVG